MESYSDYDQAVAGWWEVSSGESLVKLRDRARHYLREESRLQNIVRLIGEDALPDEQRMIVMAARLIKEGFLQQDAFHEIDRYALPEKQLKMLKAILRFCDMGLVLVRKGIPAYRLKELGAFRKLQRMKETIGNDEADQIETLIGDLETEMYREFPIAEEEFFRGAGPETASRGGNQ